MKDALFLALILVGYSTGLVVFLSSFENLKLRDALNYNLLGGLIVFILLSAVYYWRNRKK